MFQAVDWQGVFVPAILSLLKGEPINTGFFNPTWALFPLIPFGVLPYELGRILLLLAALCSYALIVRTVGGNLLALVIFILSVPTFDSLAWGNIEWLALLGLAMPQPIGLIFLAIKPQITAGIIVFWVAMALKEKGLANAIRLVLPVLVTLALSVAFFGTWFMHTLTYSPTDTLNLSFFPYSLPIGLGLLVCAIRKSDVRYAIAASPCFFPVVSPQVWLVVFLALTPTVVELAVSSLGVWAIGLAHL
jgi:hypothetical protein